MKRLHEGWVHTDGHRTHATRIELHEERKFKMTYESGNAYERFTVSIFDGDKWNVIANMDDLGIQRNSSSYINNEVEAKNRLVTMTIAGDKFIKMIMS